MAPEVSEPLGWGKIVVYDAQRVYLRVTEMLGQIQKWAVTGSY